MKSLESLLVFARNKEDDCRRFRDDPAGQRVRQNNIRLQAEKTGWVEHFSGIQGAGLPIAAVAEDDQVRLMHGIERKALIPLARAEAHNRRRPAVLLG